MVLIEKTCDVDYGYWYMDIDSQMLIVENI